jgi:hypothetical protein
MGETCKHGEDCPIFGYISNEGAVGIKVCRDCGSLLFHAVLDDREYRYELKPINLEEACQT